MMQTLVSIAMWDNPAVFLLIHREFIRCHAQFYVYDPFRMTNDIHQNR